MAKVFSTRMDEEVIDELDRLCKRLGISKKRFLEEAIRQRATQIAGEGDVWAESCGAWRRRESVETTVRRIRRAFEQSATRHHSRKRRP